MANNAVTDEKLHADFTATTQSASDNSTSVATTAYVTTAIANLADSAPSTLNTLNELAAALGDDANFSTTVTNSIATKVPLAGGTMTGNLVLSGSNTGTNPAANGHISNELKFFNSSNTDNNLDGIGFFNSNNAVDARIAGVHKSQSSRHGELAFLVHNGSALTERVRFAYDGNVGIGTSSPQAPLHVSHATAPNFRLSRTGTGQIYQFGIDSSGRFSISEAASEGGTKYQRFVIDDSGEVGIGSTAPNGLLHIGAANAVGDATNPALQIGPASGNTYRLGFYTSSEGGVIENKNGDDGIAFHTKTGNGGSFGEALRITSNGNVSLSSGQVVTPNTSGSLAARNRIDNGAMEVAQRGGSETTIDSSTSEYVCDRWAARGESGDAFLYDQDGSAPYGFRNSLKFNCSNISGGGSNQLYTISQAIEGYNIADFGFGGGSARGMSISFWVKASITGDWGGSVQNESRDRSYPFVYNIAVADDWEYKTVYIPGPTSGSWNNNTGVGIRLNFDMGCGSNFRGNAGSWNNADDRGPSGAISPMQTLNSVWRVTGVQLEMGPAATPFEYRGYPVEFVRCQRYYQRIGYGNHLAIINAINNNSARIPIPMFQTEMRAQPSYTVPTLTAFSSGTQFTVSSTHNPSKNGGGYVQLNSSPTNGIYLKLIASAELT